MRFPRFASFLLGNLVLALPAAAQPPQRDPQALVILRQSIGAIV